MTLDTFRDLLAQKPFRAFRLVMSRGSTLIGALRAVLPRDQKLLRAAAENPHGVHGGSLVPAFMNYAPPPSRPPA